MYKGRVYPTDYTVHSRNNKLESLIDDAYVVVSIDPGIRSLGLTIISRYSKDEIEIHEIKSTSLIQKNDAHENTQVMKLLQHLDSLEEWWDSLSLVIIEKQIKVNTLAVENQLLMYFLSRTPDTTVVTISPKLKGRVMGASSDLGGKGLKKWSPERFKDLCNERNDYKSLAMFESLKGRVHDMSDCALQEEAFRRLLEKIYNK